jgi:hypothetical protein
MRGSRWAISAVAVNAILATVSQAQTNSCISSTDGFWDESRLWSLNKPPSIKQSAILITNAASETITIDSITASSFASTLTITNLSVSAPSGSIDTLYLDNTGTIALHILDGLAVGVNFDGAGLRIPAGGELISTNSTLIVDGLLGGQLDDEDTMVIVGGSLITTNCSLQVGGPAPTFYTSSGLLIISNGAAQARDVSIGTGTISGSSGTMELIGGKMTLSANLNLGAGDGGGGGGLLVANGGSFTVGGFTYIASGSITVTNASFLGGGMLMGAFHAGGALTINNGTVTLRGGLNVAVGDVSDGSVQLNGGMLVVTNDIINLGGSSSGAPFTISDGTFLGQAISLQGGGRLFIQGGRSILSSTLGVGYLAAFTVSGGQLFVTNAPIAIFNNTPSIVSGGLLAAGNINLGGGSLAGILLVNGGSVTVSTGMTLGLCFNDNGGNVTVDGGELIVTNAAHTAFIDVRNGQLALSGGLLQVDKLVMTNTCSQFIHTGGTLIVGSVVLDPNAFQIVSVTPQGKDILISWLMAPGSTNALQVSSGGIHGSYNTNGFSDIFIVTNNTTAGSVTNYLDIGGATNKPSRYYRARLAP